MHRRLIAAFIGLAVAVVAFYGIPRAFALADRIQEAEQRKIERSIELLSIIIEERQPEKPVTGEFLNGLLNEAERIEYTDANGRVVAAAGTQLSGHPDDIVVTKEIPGGGTVLMSRSGAEVADRVVDAITPVALLGLVLVVVFAIIGYLLAGWLSRPFRALAGDAARLGEGKFDIPEPSYSIPEAQAIGTALHTSAKSLEELVRREREFTANASHQLRTPITALRLELEDLALWPETPPAVAAQLGCALAEVDRLTTAVSSLLELAHGQGAVAAHTVDLAELMNGSARQWRHHAQAAGRTITTKTPQSLVATVAPGPIQQILDILIDNALKHGNGEVILKASEESGHHSLSVTDHGRPAKGQTFFPSGTGDQPGQPTGLSVAKELAEAISGRLFLDNGPGTTFTLVLPRAVQAVS